MISRKEPWKSQPQVPAGVDWSNPLTRGLRAIVYAGRPYNFATNRFLTSTVQGGAITPYGLGFASAAVATNIVELPFELNGAVSIHAVVSRDASASGRDSGNPNSVASIAGNRSAALEPTFWEFNIGNSYGSASDVDKPRFINNAVAIGSIYLDGVLLSGTNPATTALTNGRFYSITASAASGATASGTGKTRLFNLNGQYGLNGRVPLIALWNRALSESEIAELSENPWQLLQPRTQYIPVSVTSGPLTHATDGALAGPGAATAGAAARFRAFASSGDLAGQIGSVVGAAARSTGTVSHDNTGALVGPVAAVVGSAARLHLFDSTGNLIGPGALLSGVSARASLYPDPSVVLAGVQYGPGGIYVGTLTGGLSETRISLRSFTGRF